jgi:cysteine desulfurase family protein (TIGR01976 family)
MTALDPATESAVPVAVGDPVRHRFPGLADGWVRLDGPAGTLPVDSSIAAMHAYYSSPGQANLGGAFEASARTGDLVDATRAAVARLVGATADEVVFGQSSTALTFQLTRALARTWRSGDRIVCTRLDHDANVTPWVLAARDTGAVVEFLDVDPVTGELDVSPLEAVCRRGPGPVRWVAVSGASNLTGSVPDLREVVRIAREHGARVHVDGVARVPHLPTDLAALDADSLTTSSYKWYGPHAGILVARRGLLHDVEPYRVRPADYAGPARWETGTPAFEVLAGILGAAEFMLEVPLADVAAAETALLGRLQSGLEAVDGVTVHGPPFDPDGERAPTLIFSVAGRRPDEVARHLAGERIAVWSGDNYACELVDALGLRPAGGAVRAGIVRYTDHDDVDALVGAVGQLGPA